MAKIQKVLIRRFKCLASIDVDLGDVTLLIGANNAGKSSILQAIHFAVSIAQSARLVGEGVVWRSDSFEVSFNPSQLLYSPVADVMSLATGGALQEPRQSQIEIELIDVDGARCIVGLRRGRNRNIAVSIVGRQIGEMLMDLQRPFTVYAPGLAGIPKEERYLSPGVVRRFVARGDANLTLRNVLRMLRKDTTAWDSFVSGMQSIFPGIKIEIDFAEDTDETIEVFYRSTDGPRLPVDAAGTSILQSSQILAYIALFKPQMLILDEPDSHLHPDNQRLLCDLIFRLSSEFGFQALISSHSRHVFDSMKDRSNLVWLSKGKKIEEPDLNATAVLMDLGALDSADYFADGQVRCVVATEDANKELLEVLLWSNGFVESDTEVASYAGCSKIESALVLGSFLKEKAPNLKLVVHRDRDYMSPANAASFANKLLSAQLHPFLTDLSDVEGSFVSAEHLHALNPGITVARINELIEMATLETADKSIGALVNLRTQEAFRERNNGGPTPDHGAISIQAHGDYNANPVKWRRGKLVLGKLQSLLQAELGSNPRVFFPTSHLQSATLSAIASAIWAQP